MRLICFFLLLTVTLLFMLTQPSNAASEHDKALYRTANKLKPLHSRLAEPQPGDWLAAHEEKGQTFRQYLAIRPVKASRRRNTIYIQPLGELSPEHKEVVKNTAEVMQAWFGLIVKIRPQLTLRSIPRKAKRTNPYSMQTQYLSTYLLHDVLAPNIPSNAAAYLGITATDLWPGRDWNFVFGQASLSKRVGVWSLARYGSLSKEDGSFTTFLRRTIKTAVHETGHMFSMKHCTLYKCLMCGSNSMQESDRRPIRMCPQCLPKLCHATGVSIRERFENLQKAFAKLNLHEEACYCLQALKAISEEQPD